MKWVENWLKRKVKLGKNQIENRDKMRENLVEIYR